MTTMQEPLYFEMHDSRLSNVSADGDDVRLEFTPLSMRTVDWSDRFPHAEMLIRAVRDAADVVHRIRAWGLPRRLSGDRILGPDGETLDPLWREGDAPTAIYVVELEPDGPEDVGFIRGRSLQVFPGAFDQAVNHPR